MIKWIQLITPKNNISVILSNIKLLVSLNHCYIPKQRADPLLSLQILLIDCISNQDSLFPLYSDHTIKTPCWLNITHFISNKNNMKNHICVYFPAYYLTSSLISPSSERSIFTHNTTFMHFRLECK